MYKFLPTHLFNQKGEKVNLKIGRSNFIREPFYTLYNFSYPVHAYSDNLN